MFDNSVGNRANPDPSATVYWGHQTADEMMFPSLGLIVDVQEHVATERPIRPSPQAGPDFVLVPNSTN